MAAPGTSARELTATNGAGEFLSLREAAASGSAFFVEVAKNMVAADFDKSGAQPAAELFALVLRLRGLQPLVLASGQRGRRHVFARVENAQWRAELKDFAKVLGADVRRDIRPPLSPHRLQGDPGLRVELLAPREPEEALAALTWQRTARAVSDRMWRVIVDGRGRSRYPSVSEYVMAAAVAVANLNWTVEDYLGLLTTEGTALAEAYRERAERRGEDATERWVRDRVWPGSVALVRESPVEGREAAQRLTAMSAWGVCRSWSGRGGPSEQAVYLALVGKACLTGRLEFNASWRELAERSAISGLNTVHRALTALQSQGLLRVAEGSGRVAPCDGPEYRGSTTWTLDWLPEMGTFLGAEPPFGDPAASAGARPVAEPGRARQGRVCGCTWRWRSSRGHLPRSLIASG